MPFEPAVCCAALHDDVAVVVLLPCRNVLILVKTCKQQINTTLLSEESERCDGAQRYNHFKLTSTRIITVPMRMLILTEITL
jgi:hypothetical protein